MDTCCLCAYFEIHYQGALSDVTPGDGATIRCLKGHYYFQNGEIGRTVNWHEMFTKSRTCPDAITPKQWRQEENTRHA